MKKIKQKLNSKRGVSIVMALLLALVCLFAGAAALTAASANIGRYTYLREDQQEYLSISSAARLLSEQFKQGGGKISANCESSSAIVTLDSPLDNGHVYSLLKSWMSSLLWHCYNKGIDGGELTSPPTETKFTVEADGFSKIDVKLTPKPVTGTGANIQEDIEVELSTGEAGERKLKFTVNLTLSADTVNKQISVTDAKVERITLPGKQEGTP